MADQTDFRALLDVAQAIAAERSSATVAAEHLLLALLSDQTSRVATLLAEHSLTAQTFSAALDKERDYTLAGIGVRIRDPARLAAAPRAYPGRPRFSASAKEALDRANVLIHKQRGHVQRAGDLALLVGILSAELGIVPRALIRGGFDRTELLASAHEALQNP
ncbi:hypothetical protein GCM10009785_23320 [Brooklawnia cerclae]|uniref:ATP-dependent Clp protease ATP-binding subunit ClpA n=1 Tax=Brooklawnia cerclae TaxID=349934 RepID=A0ABX0SF55_9ACTN|nr:Clp protease N-terminal domain-containing protein [Brooklawnia cerclae]NIH57033.1 ATP-dependent Clp protease ATP-binding subunit ClpA [Brooklawnia cerclae]